MFTILCAYLFATCLVTSLAVSMTAMVALATNADIEKISVHIATWTACIVYLAAIMLVAPLLWLVSIMVAFYRGDYAVAIATAYHGAISKMWRAIGIGAARLAETLSETAWIIDAPVSGRRLRALFSSPARIDVAIRGWFADRCAYGAWSANRFSIKLLRE